MSGVDAANSSAGPPPSREAYAWARSAWCIVAAFGTYFCMYAFRKPFAASKYEGVEFAFYGWAVGYKLLLVNAQVIGYTISKFLGIKVIAELTPQRRITGIIVLIAIAEAALLLFAVVPPPYSALCLLVNGLPLGMVFGMVVSFLEGRRMTDLMMAAICASFILADGAAKSLGALLLANGVPDAWMPAAAGLIAAAPMTVFILMLARVPLPTQADIAQRAKRQPMNARQRWNFFLSYAVGLSAVLVMYMLITVLRSIRSDYAAEIWSGLLGREVKTPPQVFTTSETFVALTVMISTGMCFLIRDSRKAFFIALAISAGGGLLIGLSVAGLKAGALDAFPFMVLTGIGLYLPYVAVHTTIFERLIAITRDRGNLGYFLYLADAFGYLGYPIFMLGVRLVVGRPDYLRLFSATAACVSVAVFVCVAIAGAYFRGLQPRAAAAAEIPVRTDNLEEVAS